MAYISGFPQQLHDFFSRPSTRDPEMRRLICFWSIILAAHPSVKTLMFRFVKELLMHVVLAHPFQERHEGGEALSILRVAQLVHQALSLLLGEFLTQVGQQPEEI